jgi:hypothetical protein
VNGDRDGLEARPVIVLSPTTPISSDSVLNAIEDLLASNDDVLSKDFMTDTVIIQHASSLKGIWLQHKALDLKTSIGAWKVQEFVELINSTGQNPLPDGPYFLFDGGLHQAWRLYSDHLDAFATTVIPSPEDHTKYDFLR